MKRYSYFFKQEVTHDELNAGFDAVESAIRNLPIDLRLVGIAGVGGTFNEDTAGPVTQNSPLGLSVIMAPHTAIDTSGRRIKMPDYQTINVATDSNALTTTVSGSGNERWVLITLRFKTVATDERFDGNGVAVNYQIDESYDVIVTRGPEAVAGSADRPTPVAGDILVCDVHRTFGQTTILTSDIYLDRRQFMKIPALHLPNGLVEVKYGQTDALVQNTTTSFADIASVKTALNFSTNMRYGDYLLTWWSGNVYATSGTGRVRMNGAINGGPGLVATVGSDPKVYTTRIEIQPYPPTAPYTASPYNPAMQLQMASDNNGVAVNAPAGVTTGAFLLRT